MTDFEGAFFRCFYISVFFCVNFRSFASAEATGDVAGSHKLLKKLEQNFKKRIFIVVYLCLYGELL